jgi:hypothetical protein
LSDTSLNKRWPTSITHYKWCFTCPETLQGLRLSAVPLGFEDPNSYGPNGLTCPVGVARTPTAAH